MISLKTTARKFWNGLWMLHYVRDQNNRTASPSVWTRYVCTICVHWISQVVYFRIIYTYRYIKPDAANGYIRNAKYNKIIHKITDTVETSLIKDLKSWAYVIIIDDTTRFTSSIKWCEVSKILEIKRISLLVSEIRHVGWCMKLANIANAVVYWPRV